MIYVDFNKCFEFYFEICCIGYVNLIWFFFVRVSFRVKDSSGYWVRLGEGVNVGFGLLGKEGVGNWELVLGRLYVVGGRIVSEFRF